MLTLLQLSDFHIKEGMPEPVNNPIIKSLVSFLKDLKLGNIILVYNGDVIDAKTIEEKIPVGASESEKQELWDKEAEKAFKKAEKYFDYIMKGLNIDNRHVVICCGNHDVNPFYPKTEKFNCFYDGEKQKIYYNPKRFDQWKYFCERMKFFEAKYDNTIITIEDLNFIVINCQWRNKHENNSLCMNCSSILRLFSENESEIAKAVSDKEKDNIYVAHNPFGDICENKKYPWPQNKYVSIINKVNDTCVLQLFGDKHTSSVLGDQYLVGAPLSPNKKENKGQPIVYRLHSFDTGKILHKAIVYEKGGWKSWYDIADLREIYEISKSSLKDRALVYLFEDPNKDTVVQKMESFDRYKKQKNWKKIDKLYKPTVRISVVQENGRSTRIPSDAYGIIETVCSAINNHNSTNSKVNMFLKGDYRSGKSTFVSIVYLNLLYGFNNGTIKDIPVYINLESLDNYYESNCRNEKALLQTVKDILESMASMAKRFQQKVCLIIDGIPQYLYSKNSMYDNINTLIKDYDEHIDKYVYCIDTIDNLQYEYSTFYKESAKYLTYFGSISTQVFSPNPLYKSYLNGFCDIEGINDKISTVIHNFDEFRFKNIDFCLMTVLKEILTKEGEGINLTKEIKEILISRLGGEQNLALAAKAAYLLYYENKDLTDIQRIVKSKSFSPIFSVIRLKLFSQYLIAQNYINIIKNTTRKTNKLMNTDKAALNHLYEDDVARFIVDSFFSDEIQPKTLIDFEKSNYKSLSFSGKSMLTYLTSKVKYGNELVNILNREKNELEVSYNDEISKGLKGRELYEYYVAKRSIEIGLTRNDKLYHNNNEYIIKLLYDKYERRINREFYLEFYGDRSKTEHKLEEEVIFKGVDFYHTYHMLTRRLEKWQTEGVETELSRLELFTICDLIQVRLDNPTITYKRVRNSLQKVNSNEKSNASLFYNPEYNNENKNNGVCILDTALRAIRYYLKNNNSRENTDLFVQYLRYEEQLFSDAKIKLKSGDFEYSDNSGSLLRTLTQLGSVKKVGWYFSSTPARITEKELKSVVDGKEIIESVLEHVYEAYIMGLLYLPNEDKLCKEYKKQDVLNMLLIHDLGENEIGDYPPFYYEYDKILENERKKCRTYFLAGQHAEYETMIDYLKLWDGWASNSNNINILIAKEIDKIQMLYKLLNIIKDGKAIFTEERFKNFFNAVSTIRTSQGRSVYNRVIARNTEFVKIAKNYQYEIVII